MLHATVANNKLVIKNVSSALQHLIKAQCNSAQNYGSTLHIPLTPFSIAQLSVALKSCNQQIEPNSVPILRKLYKEYQEILESRSIKTMQDLPQPAIRLTEQWNHQKQAYHFAMKCRNAMLHMGVGTGKTKTTVDILQNTDANSVVVVMPKHLLDDNNAWKKQFRIHSKKEYYQIALVKGSTAKKVEFLKEELEYAKMCGKPVVVFVNFETIWREPLATFLLKSGLKDAIVIDESHRIKSHKSKVSEYLYKLGLQFDRRLCLTGTMQGNSPLDVYGQFRFLDAGVFGLGWTKFRESYANYYDHDGVPILTGYKNLDELGAKADKITYFAPASVLNLPEPIHDQRSFTLSKEEHKLYKELETTFGLELRQGTISAVNKVVLLLRLQQLTGGNLPLESDTTGEMTSHRIADSKMNLLDQILTDVPINERVVVYYRFTADGQRIEEIAKKQKRSFAMIGSGRHEKHLWDSGRADIVALNTASGEGIDLHQANLGIVYSLGRSLLQYIQCIGRVQRPPRTNTAYFIHLIAAGTIDEVVYQGLQNNQEIVDVVQSYLTGSAKL